MSNAPDNDIPIRVLGFAGSLRAGSYNRVLLRAARELAPGGMDIDTFDLAGIPLYNGDLDRDGERPEAVERFKAAIAEADRVLVATPEYKGYFRDRCCWRIAEASKISSLGQLET